MQCPQQAPVRWGLACWAALTFFTILSFSRFRQRPQPQDYLWHTRFEVVRHGNSSFQLFKNGEPFVIKGVCYSPMEIASNVNDAAVVLETGTDYSRVTSSMFGDSFWDALTLLGTVEESSMKNWYGLWGSGRLTEEHSGRGDLAAIAQTLHANTLRVYFMQSRVYEEVSHRVTKNPEDCEKRTHTAFLDEAYKNGLYVLVGLPLPINLFHAGDYKKAPTGLVEWWEFVMAETVAEVGRHPATLGFTIMNELDDEPNAFPGAGKHPRPDYRSDFFHNQVVKYASIVRALAPGKLVGWALHDCPSWPGFAGNAKPSAPTEYLTTGATYLEQISAVFDYYGVNTYQSQSLMSVLGHWGDHGEIGGGGKAYGAPSISAHMKPVLFTEMGWPATGRADVNDPASVIVDDERTQTAVADLITHMLPQVYDEFKHICIGAFYFEYTDEWWKTPKPLAAEESLAGPWRHDGGNNCANPGFPNMCNDEESFGLYARARSGGRHVNSSNFGEAGIALPVDELIPRLPMVEALARIFANLTGPPDQTPLWSLQSTDILSMSQRLAVNAAFPLIACMLLLCTAVLCLLPKILAAFSNRFDVAFNPEDPGKLQQPLLRVV